MVKNLDQEVETERVDALAEDIAAELAESNETYGAAYHKIKLCRDSFRLRAEVLEKAGWALKDHAFHQVKDKKPVLEKTHLN